MADGPGLGWTWKTRCVLTAADNGGAAFTGFVYPIKVVIGTGPSTSFSHNGVTGGLLYVKAGFCRSDFMDLRFYSGSSAADFCRVSKTDGDNAVFLVELPYDASNLVGNVDVYYGNLSASSDVSSAVNTFVDVISGVVGAWDMGETSGSNVADSSGNGNNGTATGTSVVDNTFYTGKKMRSSDGVGDVITVADANVIDFGTADFSISANINVPANASDVYGDLLQKFNASAKVGVNLGFSQGAGNRGGNLFFGINNNVSDNIWTEVAPELNSETDILSLAVFNGKLYGSTLPNGNLFEWNGSNAWVQVAPKLNNEIYIYSLAVFNGKLYGATAGNGNLFEWNGSNAWVQVAPKLNSETHILSLAVFNGKLYGGTLPNGNLFEWNGVNAWVQVAPKLNSETYIRSLAVFNGKLYGGTAENGNLFEWNGSNAWVQVAPKLNSETHILSLAVFNGKLYGGTLPNGNLFEWNGSNAWVQVAPKLNSETYIRSLAVFNGKLYGGTLPNGNLFEWNGSNAWVQVAPKLNNEIYIYSLAVFNGKLYGGTLPNGNLFEWKSGVATSYDTTLTTGNHHVTATKTDAVGTSTLRLYIDGVLRGTSATFTTAAYDLANTANLLFGSGATDSFLGKYSNLHITSTSLSQTQITLLATATNYPDSTVLAGSICCRPWASSSNPAHNYWEPEAPTGYLGEEYYYYNTGQLTKKLKETTPQFEVENNRLGKSNVDFSMEACRQQQLTRDAEYVLGQAEKNRLFRNRSNS